MFMRVLFAGFTHDTNQPSKKQVGREMCVVCVEELLVKNVKQEGSLVCIELLMHVMSRH